MHTGSEVDSTRTVSVLTATRVQYGRGSGCMCPHKVSVTSRAVTMAVRPWGDGGAGGAGVMPAAVRYGHDSSSWSLTARASAAAKGHSGWQQRGCKRVSQ